jgi:hypothetical protein
VYILLFPCLTFAQQDCGEAPKLNQDIVALANSVIGKKVGTGECWDLAQWTLDQTGANWDGYENFGKRVDYRKNCLYPGDIIQFQNVKLKWEEGKYTYTETMKHHTALIYNIEEDGTIVLIHQNTGQHGRKVGTTVFRIQDMQKGKITVYRPQE